MDKFVNIDSSVFISVGPLGQSNNITKTASVLHWRQPGHQIGVSCGASRRYPYGFNGKEKDDEVKGGGDSYDYGMRIYDSRLGRFMSVDPLQSKSPAWSPYRAFYCNPLTYNDPTGMLESTDVTKNKNGTYTVAGGKVDGDKNIYVVGSNGKRTGEIVGKSLTQYSFLNDKGNGVKGAIINPNDNSGVDFLNKDIMGDNLSTLNYMHNAGNGQKYDFKEIGRKKGSLGLKADQYRYRGMPFKGVNGFEDSKTPTFASARDIGNIGAGFVAG